MTLTALMIRCQKTVRKGLFYKNSFVYCFVNLQITLYLICNFSLLYVHSKDDCMVLLHSINI